MLPMWMDPQQRYYAQQQLDQQAQQDARYGYSDQLSAMRQQQNNRDQAISNVNQAAGLGNQVAQQGYNLWGDAQRLGLQTLNMQGDLLNQQRNENRYALNAQTNLAQAQQSQQRYLQGLQQDIQRTQYQRSTSEIPGASSVLRRFGY